MKLLSTVRTVNNNSISSILRCRDVSSQFTFLCDRSRQNSYHNVLRSFRRITPLQLTEAAGFDDGVGSNDDQHNKISEKAEESDSETDNSATVGGSLLAIAVILGTVAAIGGAGYVFKDQLNVFLQHFEGIVEGMGPSGYAVFVLGYALLEMLAIPAIPLTMSAGLLFGTVTGTVLVSVAGTIAATGAFFVARYAIRDRVFNLVKSNKKYMAIDKAIGEDSFRVVLLLRLSPLLPFSIGNYIYGITSVKVVPYVIGSWLGMLPGTWAYVSAGSLGRSLLETAEGHSFQGGTELLTLGVGLLATFGAASYVTNLAKGAIKDIKD